VSLKFGIIVRDVYEVGIKEIRTINVTQGIIESIFDFGAVEILSADSAGVEVRFSGIRNLITIDDMIHRQKDETESD